VFSDILAKDKESSVAWEARVEENLNRKKAPTVAAAATPNFIPTPINLFSAAIANHRGGYPHTLSAPASKRQRRGLKAKVNFHG